ncbi:hypothetical protein [Nonomuraea typhae]|uniref:CU044_5270 family protein n=1 Tax=Nonomuraea typhae TaxID=2603600 RepID=A0ABW7YT90_9ACTN
MDELELIRGLHGDPAPDPGLKARVRERLAAERRRGRRRVFAWTLAAGAVAAVVLAVWMYRPVQLHHAAGTPAGRTILLAAASSAGATSTRAGTRYWHLRERQGARVTELWAATDGRAWRRAGDGGVTRVPGAPFSMAGRDLTYQDVQRLPAEPARLRAHVTGLLPPGAGPGVLADALGGLLMRKPSPPGVRAAAYQLLADLPNVRYEGPRPTGRHPEAAAFSFALDDVKRTLVIDPVTSRVLSVTDGREPTVTIEAAYTDRGPTG